MRRAQSLARRGRGHRRHRRREHAAVENPRGGLGRGRDGARPAGDPRARGPADGPDQHRHAQGRRRCRGARRRGGDRQRRLGSARRSRHGRGDRRASGHRASSPCTTSTAPSTATCMEDVCLGLRESLAIAEKAGIPSSQVIIDPGFGFAKTPAHNLELVRRLGELMGIGHAVLVGPSRKSTTGMLIDEHGPGAPPRAAASRWRCCPCRPARTWFACTTSPRRCARCAPPTPWCAARPRRCETCRSPARPGERRRRRHRHRMGVAGQQHGSSRQEPRPAPRCAHRRRRDHHRRVAGDPHAARRRYRAGRLSQPGGPPAAARSRGRRGAGSSTAKPPRSRRDGVPPTDGVRASRTRTSCCSGEHGEIHVQEPGLTVPAPRDRQPSLRAAVARGGRLPAA